MSSTPLSSEAFADAVLRVAPFRNQTVVVKLGGSAMEDPAATDACLRSVAVLHTLGLAIVLVHGGGKPIDRAMAEAGLTPKKVAGRRYTDDATLAIVVRVLTEINHNLAIRLQELGAEAAAYTGSHHFPLKGEILKLPASDGRLVDLGWVGTVVKTDDESLRWRLLECGEVPVIPCLALDSSGNWLNINADTAASAVAGALKADRAIFLTDTPGVLRDRSDTQSLLPHLTEQECRALIASGVIEGGMVPKVEACFEALEAGARSALILDGRVPYSLLEVFLRDTFAGTEITR